MALLQLKQNTKYTESSFKRQSIKTLGLEKPRAVLHLNVLFLLQESNSERLAFTGLKRTETDSFKWDWKPVHTNAFCFIPSAVFLCCLLSHKHIQCLRVGQRAGPDYSRWALCSWGLAQRWEEGEDKQTVCLLSDYSMQCVCVRAHIWFRSACGY